MSTRSDGWFNVETSTSKYKECHQAVQTQPSQRKTTSEFCMLIKYEFEVLYVE